MLIMKQVPIFKPVALGALVTISIPKEHDIILVCPCHEHESEIFSLEKGESMKAFVAHYQEDEIDFVTVDKEGLIHDFSLRTYEVEGGKVVMEVETDG